MTIILVAFNFFERVLKIINFSFLLCSVPVHLSMQNADNTAGSADIESEAMDKEKRKHQMYVTYQII